MIRGVTCDIPVVESDRRPMWLVSNFVVPGVIALVSPLCPKSPLRQSRLVCTYLSSCSGGFLFFFWSILFQ